MALDNFSQAFLRFGMYQQASEFLYPTLNHASPLVTWCEERGAEKNSKTKTGNFQHLWTPLAVVSYIVSAFVFEDDNILHIAAGLPENWYNQKVIANVKGIYTGSGKTDLKLEKLKDKYRFTFKAERIPNRLVVHYMGKDGERKEIELNELSENIVTEFC